MSSTPRPSTDRETDEYRAAQLWDRLVKDRRVSEPELRVVVTGGRVVVSGMVATPERRAAIAAVIAEAAPDLELRNDTTVLGRVAAPAPEEPLS